MFFSQNLRLYVTHQYTSFRHCQFAVLQHATGIGEWLFDEVINLLHLNPHQRFLLPLLLCGRGFYLLLRRRNMAIKHPEVDGVRLLGQCSRFLHVVHQFDVGAPRYVFDRILVWRVVHQLVERLIHIFMLELFSLLRVVRDVPRDVRRGVEADLTVDFHQFYSAVQVKADQLLEHHVVLLLEKGTDQLPAERTGGSEVLGAQVVLLLAGDLRLDCYYFRSERIVIVSLVVQVDTPSQHQK